MSANTEKQLVPFFKAWRSYFENLVRAYFYRESASTSPTKFSSLKDVDKHFEIAIKPLLQKFFARNPLIDEAHGEAKDTELYLSLLKAWWPEPELTGSKLLAPRVIYNRGGDKSYPLESGKDLAEVERWTLNGIKDEQLKELKSRLWKELFEGRFGLLQESLEYFQVKGIWMAIEKDWDKCREAVCALAEKEKKLAQPGPAGEKDAESPAYQWELDEEKQAVYCNGKGPVKLSKVGYTDGLLLKLFRCLYTQWGKNSRAWVKERTLKKCWDKEPDYTTFVSDTISRLRTTLRSGLEEQGLKIQGEIIEFNNDKKAPSWRLC